MVDSTPAATFVTLGDMSLIRMTGRDRAQFLHNFCTNDLLKRSPGDGCEAFVTDAKAHILAHVLIFLQTDAILVATFVPQADELIEHWERYHIMEDVHIEDLTSTSAGTVVMAPEWHPAFSGGGMTPGGDPWSHCGTADRQSPFLVVRLPFSAADSAFLLLTAREWQEAVEKVLVSAGITSGPRSAFEERRILNGLPVYGRDITRENLPQEVNRDELAISFTKGCYLGQETVARIDALGHVNRRLVPLQLAGQSTPQVGEPIFAEADSQSVGMISSSIWSPRRQAALALAMVRRTAANPGTRLTCPSGAANVLARC